MGMGLFCSAACAFTAWAGFLAYSEGRIEVAAVHAGLTILNALLAIANFVRAR